MCNPKDWGSLAQQFPGFRESVMMICFCAQITYWDPYDGQAIRILDGSSSEPVNALATDADGEVVVSGGCDKLVKLWGYDEGHCYYVGVAHSGSITKVQVAPNKSQIISVGTEGGIFLWEYSRPQAVDIMD